MINLDWLQNGIPCIKTNQINFIRTYQIGCTTTQIVYIDVYIDHGALPSPVP